LPSKTIIVTSCGGDTSLPPDARRRDIDNYNKALFDALTHAGIWEDDSQVKRMLVEWGPKVPGGRLKYRSAAMNKKVAK
jgi:crossover junction endodeoxyribonuclease RusA